MGSRFENVKGAGGEYGIKELNHSTPRGAFHWFESVIGVALTSAGEGKDEWGGERWKRKRLA